MQHTYGKMILRKNTLLYHSSNNPFCENNEKPMLFVTFHPSEWDAKYVTQFRLKKDISLFFMVRKLYENRVLPLLDILVNIHQGDVSAKQDDKNLRCFVNYLNNDGLDGWFSTIEGKCAVEVALINSPDLFERMTCNKTVYDWDEFDDYNLGNTYILSTLLLPVKLVINKYFEPMIHDYVGLTKFKCIFKIILSNAEITYIDSPIEPIVWKIDGSGEEESRVHKTQAEDERERRRIIAIKRSFLPK